METLFKIYIIDIGHQNSSNQIVESFLQLVYGSAFQLLFALLVDDALTLSRYLQDWKLRVKVWFGKKCHNVIWTIFKFQLCFSFTYSKIFVICQMKFVNFNAFFSNQTLSVCYTKYKLEMSHLHTKPGAKISL